MSQVATIRPRLAAAYIGAESSYASAATTTRLHLIEGSCEFELGQPQIENMEQVAQAFGAKASVDGMKGGTLKFGIYLCPPASQLDASATLSETYQHICMRLAFGGQYPASGTTTVGTTTASAASASSWTVASATNVTKGVYVLPTVSGAPEPAYVANLSGVTVTPCPATSATPTAASAAHLAMVNYYPTSAAPASATFEFALADDSSQQFRLLGCVCTGVEFVVTRGEMLRANFTFEVGTWTTPSSALGLTAAAATNTLTPITVRSGRMILQAAATTTHPASYYAIDELSFAIALGNQTITELGGTEGKSGIARVPQRPFAKATVVAKPDISGGAMVPFATWTPSKTPLQMHVAFQYGSGSTTRWAVFGMPTCTVDSTPALVMPADGLMRLRFDLRALLSTITTTPGTDEKALAPFVVALG